jgi:hypothetical protein
MRSLALVGLLLALLLAEVSVFTRLVRTFCEHVAERGAREHAPPNAR